jgi:diguanylate cyclase (GGDEF)-like protein
VHAVDSRRSHDEGSSVERQLRALLEVAAAVAAAPRLDDVLELAAEHALAASGAASLSISRWSVASQAISTLINVGQLATGEERRPKDEVYPAADYPRLRALSSGVPQLSAVDDPASDPAQRALLARLGKESAIGVPIRFRGEVWGELWATTSPGAPRFTGEDVVFLQTIAEQLGAAIGRAELFERIETLAYTDPLTSLANRRALDEALDRALGTPEREVALVVCDVDGLKRTNDERGHAAGDAILVRVADALSAAAADHPEAVVSRIGGDEFCVLLPVGGIPAARAVVQASTRALRTGDAPITVSCGAASTHGGTASGLLRAADAAQYEAKRHGGVFREAEVEAGDEPGSRWRRRSYRDRETWDVGALVAGTLEALDGELAAAPCSDRLAAVAARAGWMTGCSGWAVGFARAGADVPSTIRSSDGAEVPLPAAARDWVSGAVLRPGDPAADRDLSERLRAAGLEVVIVVATPTPEGTWLTALLSDEPAPALAELAPELRLLALAAVAGRLA